MIHELTDLGQKHARTIKRLAKRVGQSSEKMGEALVAGAKRKFGSRSNLLIHRFWGKTVTKIEKKSAKEVNATYIAAGKNKPYKDGTTVLEGVTAEEHRYVRVSKEGVSNPEGDWLVREEDIAGLTNEKIADVLGLTYIPDKLSLAKIPTGVRIRTGAVAPIKDKVTGKIIRNGGARQFQLLDDFKKEWFTPLKDI